MTRSESPDRHVVVMTCNNVEQQTLLREVANGCTQLLLDVQADLRDGQTVAVTSVDVVTAHTGARQDLYGSLISPFGRPTQHAVVITAEVRTKPQDAPTAGPAAPDPAESAAAGAP